MAQTKKGTESILDTFILQIFRDGWGLDYLAEFCEDLKPWLSTWNAKKCRHFKRHICGYICINV